MLLVALCDNYDEIQVSPSLTQPMVTEKVKLMCVEEVVVSSFSFEMFANHFRCMLTKQIGVFISIKRHYDFEQISLDFSGNWRIVEYENTRTFHYTVGTKQKENDFFR